MNTLLAITLLATAYGFIMTIFYFAEKAKLKTAKKNIETLSKQLGSTRDENTSLYKQLKSVQADRDQLAQALKETQSKLQKRGKDGRYQTKGKK